MQKPSQQLSVLLASASAGGTIAAVRSLGDHGVRVSVLASQRFSAAAWSRRTTRSYHAPSETHSDAFLERLLAVGESDPGQILLPTSDETAWLYTLNAERLAKNFQVHQPSIASLQHILDKKLLADAALGAGLAVLPTWDPRGTDEVIGLAPTLPYPLLIKPRTQVHRLHNDKGIVVRSSSELSAQYLIFLRREQCRITENPLIPDARIPLLQEFVPTAERGVCSVSGFIDRTGELFVTRRSTKIFLRSNPVGVGICYESLPPDAALSDGVRRLCTTLGFHGIFEVEFLRFKNGWAVIDFNPRLYNQVGMDIHRGMPLPLLACLDAAGQTAALREAVLLAKKNEGAARMVFCDGFTLRLILAARKLTARISRVEVAYWRNWLAQNEAHCVDVAADDSDRMPRLMHAFSEIALGLRALPRFLRLTSRVS